MRGKRGAFIIVVILMVVASAAPSSAATSSATSSAAAITIVISACSCIADGIMAVALRGGQFIVRGVITVSIAFFGGVFVVRVLNSRVRVRIGDGLLRDG